MDPTVINMERDHDHRYNLTFLPWMVPIPSGQIWMASGPLKSFHLANEKGPASCNQLQLNNINHSRPSAAIFVLMIRTHDHKVPKANLLQGTVLSNNKREIGVSQRD